MARAGRYGRFVLASAAAGSALWAAWLVAGRPGSPPPRTAAASTRESAVRDITTPRKQIPLDCRLVPAGEAQQRARLEQRLLFQDHPEWLTPRLCRNPLVADGAWVEVENTSSRDFGIYPLGGKLFWETTRIEDAAGHPVSFERPGIRSLKRLGSALPGTPIATLKPGQVERQAFDLLGIIGAGANVKPGRYTVRAVCWYFRAPDGADCQVESAPLTVTITEEDIREWKDLFERDWTPDGGIEEKTP